MMTFDETTTRINAIAEEVLVKLAHDPESRFLIELPALTEEHEEVPVMECLEYVYGVARLREVLTYKYLLGAMKAKKLAVSHEALATCLRNLRKAPVIDYYDLGDYHEFAYHFYKQTGNEKKATRHLLESYMDRGRAILSADKVFDSKDLILLLLKDHQRMQTFLMYILNFVYYDMEEVLDFLERSQYLLLERAMVLAVKLMAENPACDAKLRSCVYYVEAQYDELTNRKEEAKAARKAAQKLGGKKKLDLVLQSLLMQQPDPHWADECFLDYVLYGPSVEEQEIYPTDEEGNPDFNQKAEDPIVVKDGRANFMDTYYREMPDAEEFRSLYEAAEQGDTNAKHEVARRFREGDGVAACEAAATVWRTR